MSSLVILQVIGTSPAASDTGVTAAYKSAFLKNVSNTNGIPFIAKKFRSTPSTCNRRRCVGTSDLNVLGIGAFVVPIEENVSVSPTTLTSPPYTIESPIVDQDETRDVEMSACFVLLVAKSQ